MNEIITELINLYLGVKVRKNDEIEDIDSNLINMERKRLRNEDVSAMTLITYIKVSIETLI
jgi:hypothetical protein